MPTCLSLASFCLYACVTNPSSRWMSNVFMFTCVLGGGGVVLATELNPPPPLPLWLCGVSLLYLLMKAPLKCTLAALWFSCAGCGRWTLQGRAFRSVENRVELKMLFDVHPLRCCTTKNMITTYFIYYYAFLMHIFQFLSRQATTSSSLPLFVVSPIKIVYLVDYLEVAPG